MTEKRFNCHVKFSKMPNGFMVLDYTKKGKEQTVIEDISREKAHSVMDRLNELNDENEQLKQFKKQVLQLIDEKIKDCDTRECDCCRNCIGNQLLGELKKELEND